MCDSPVEGNAELLRGRNNLLFFFLTIILPLPGRIHYHHPPTLRLIRCSTFILYGRAVGKAFITFLYWVVWYIQLSIYIEGQGRHWQGEIWSEALLVELPSWWLAPSASRNSQGRSKPSDHYASSPTSLLAPYTHQASSSASSLSVRCSPVLPWSVFLT